MADEEQSEDSGGGGGGKKLIVGIVVGLLLGGGGAAGYFITQGGGEEAPVEKVEEKEPEAPDYQYARMDKLQLPVFYKGRVLNYTVMDVSMEVVGNENKMKLVKNVLIIRDALLRHYSVNSVGRADNPRIVDYDKLADKIKEFANNEMHSDMVSRVVISESRSF